MFVVIVPLEMCPQPRHRAHLYTQVVLHCFPYRSQDLIGALPLSIFPLFRSSMALPSVIITVLVHVFVQSRSRTIEAGASLTKVQTA